MHTAFGKARSSGKASDAHLSVLTNRVANLNTFSPQWHGAGPCSEGWLKSWWNSAVQSTRSTTVCPALDCGPRSRHLIVVAVTKKDPPPAIPQQAGSTKLIHSTASPRHHII